MSCTGSEMGAGPGREKGADGHALTYSEFACIGAGFSGIGLGATLKRWHNITDLVLFERETGLGGTWHINQYPGCACDIPATLYSFSFAPNANWTQFFNSRQDIVDYLTNISNQYGLADKIRYNSAVERCHWSESRQRWRITIRHTQSATLSYHESKFLYSGVGQLLDPRIPEIPGIDTFNGHLFHAQRWKKDISLQDKRVIVVGNGCTADQIVPAIVDEAKSVTQIFRSKHWIVQSPPDINFSLMCFLFKKVPGFLRFVRLATWIWFELSWRHFNQTKYAASLRKNAETSSIAYLKKIAPAKYHDMLTPDFPIGCKRRIFNPGYLECLNDEKITLREEAILEVVPQGVVTKSGLIEADIIVFATGYYTNNFLPRLELIGRNGETAEEHWKKRNGAGAYNTVLLSGFPNFFMILGPNTVTGHTSTVFAIENAINYSLRIIKPILDGETSSVDCLPQAELRYEKEIQDGLQNTVWAPGNCNNWYSRDNQGNQSHNASTYPFTQFHHWYTSFFPIYDDLAYTPRFDARRKMTVSRLITIVAITLPVLIAYRAVREAQAQGVKNMLQACLLDAVKRYHALHIYAANVFGRK